MKINLRKYRELLKLSQVEFAKLLNVSQSSISLYERGKMPTLRVAFALKNLLKRKLDLNLTWEAFFN